MNIYEELVERGLIAQVTNENEIKELINNGKAVFTYIKDRKVVAIIAPEVS